MFFHDKKVIINIFHKKNLDFGKTGFSNSKKKNLLGNLWLFFWTLLKVF